MASGRSIRYSRCGASIELHAAALTAPCSSCGHHEPVPPKLAEELRLYEGQHAAEIASANASLQKAQSLENMAGQMPSSNSVFKLFGVVLGVVVVGGGGLQFMLLNGSCSGEAQQSAMMVFPFGVMLVWLGIPFFLAFRRSRRKAEHVSAGVVQVACPTCGASNQLVAGDTSAGCAYCGARLVPSPTVVRRVLDAAAMSARQAGMMELRAQRKMTLRMRNAGVNPVMIAIGSYGFMIVGGCGAGLVNALIEGNAHVASILSLVILAFSLPCFLYFYWRGRRRDRWAAPMFDLAGQFEGRYSTKLDDQVRWLNAYWPITYSEYYITGVGLRFGTLSASAGGYAVLLDAHPEKPYGSQRYAQGFRARLNVLLAAYIPLEAQSRSRLSPEAKLHYATLRSMGFKVSLSTAGILAEGNEALIERFSKKPEELHLLAQTFQSLALLASHLGPPTSSIP